MTKKKYSVILTIISALCGALIFIPGFYKCKYTTTIYYTTTSIDPDSFFGLLFMNDLRYIFTVLFIALVLCVIALVWFKYYKKNGDISTPVLIIGLVLLIIIIVGTIAGKGTINNRTSQYSPKLDITLTFIRKYQGLGFLFYVELILCAAVSAFGFLGCKRVKELPNVKSSVNSTTPEPVSQNGAENAVDELVKYKQLFDCGAITEEEFKEKKKQILGI